jgi:hypothetical protein
LETTSSTLSESEFEVLDNLYFLTTFESLKELNGLGLPLLDILKSLINKGFIKVLDRKGEREVISFNFDKELSNYSFLITKEGLLKHNSR